MLVVFVSSMYQSHKELSSLNNNITSSSRFGSGGGGSGSGGGGGLSFTDKFNNFRQQSTGWNSGSRNGRGERGRGNGGVRTINDFPKQSKSS